MATRPKHQAMTIKKNLDRSLQSKKSPRRIGTQIREDDKRAGLARRRIEELEELRAFTKQWEP